jgi:hypothetical protein
VGNKEEGKEEEEKVEEKEQEKRRRKGRSGGRRGFYLLCVLSHSRSCNCRARILF